MGREEIDRIEELVRRAESLRDGEAREVAVELVQAVLAFHAAALGRMVELADDAMMERMARDELASSMLLLHGLHPDAIETRVERAVDKLAQMFHSLGARLSLVALEDGVARLQFDSSRAWPGATVRESVESAIYQAAPEVTGVVIEGIKEAPSADFVPLSDLLADAPV
jgi:hypothetical protein